MRCPVCEESDASVGILCADCRQELDGPTKITPEQLQPRVVNVTKAALIDVWGRSHRLAPRTLIGRDVDERGGLAILEPSISRKHALIYVDGETWALSDLGSANHTYVDDRQVTDALPLTRGDRVRFGGVRFFFVCDASKFAALPGEFDSEEISQPTIVLAKKKTTDLVATDPALPTFTIVLHEPTGGGGGVVEIEGKQIQLTVPQFELVALLVRRMASDVEPDHLRGFVSGPELIDRLSLEASVPNDDHIRQLVRRVRRALMKAELGDLIESRYGMGYRLRAIPRIK